MYRAEARVRLSPLVRSLLPLLGLHVAAVNATASEPAGDGSIECVIPLESLKSGVSVMMRLGDEVEVLAPASLRTRAAV